MPSRRIFYSFRIIQTKQKRWLVNRRSFLRYQFARWRGNVTLRHPYRQSAVPPCFLSFSLFPPPPLPPPPPSLPGFNVEQKKIAGPQHSGGNRDGDRWSATITSLEGPVRGRNDLRGSCSCREINETAASRRRSKISPSPPPSLLLLLSPSPGSAPGRFRRPGARSRARK